MMRTAFVLSVGIAVAAPAFAQSTPNPKVYKQLFAAQQQLKAAIAPSQATPAPQKPKVVCGMMIVPADPTIDPQMRITPPQNPNLEYKIRVVEPSICKPSNK